MRRSDYAQGQILRYDQLLATGTLVGVVRFPSLPLATYKELVGMWWDMHINALVSSPSDKVGRS